MKLKTITCHDVYNFGASLQTYALMTYLSELGHDVEVIDYKPKYSTFSLWSIGSKWKKNIFLQLLFYAYVVPKRLLLKKRRNRFDKFTASRLSLTKQRYYSIEELKENTPVADVYFAGSDQIWNTASNNGKDAAFYLLFAPDTAIKASYAASFSVPTIQDEYKPKVKEWLSHLDFISVREKTGLNILNELGYTEGQVVVDPVFLLNRAQWSVLAKRVVDADDKYIFIYDQENNPEIKRTALDIAKKNNLKIIAIESLYSMFYADKKVKDAGPEEFLGLIQHCEVCLTNSFHCVSFSLIFNKEFYLFPRKHENVNSRMVDLLSMLNLKDRIINTGIKLNSMKRIDYSQVDRILEKKKESSVKYIERILQKASKK